MSEPLRITDARAAAALADPRRRRILLALVPGERSASELEAETQTPLNLLHYHLGRLLAARLVRVARVAARSGRPVKFYRAVATAFLVPAELSAVLPGAAQAVRLRAALDRSLARSVEGVLYWHDGTGPRMRLLRDPHSAQEATELWLELRLTERDFAALGEELRALLGRYARRPQRGARSCLVHAAAVRVQRGPKGR
jgi:DNA-binding transcriptional ArsR family regulator